MSGNATSDAPSPVSYHKKMVSVKSSQKNGYIAIPPGVINEAKSGIRAGVSSIRLMWSFLSKWDISDMDTRGHR